MANPKPKGMGGVKDSALLLFMRIGNVVIALGVQSALAWLLAPEGRGAFGVCVVFASLLALIFGFGADRAIQYYVIAKRFTVAQATTVSLYVALAGAALASACGGLLIDSPLEYFTKASRESFQLALVFVPLQMATSYLQLIMTAQRRFAEMGYSLLINPLINIPLVLFTVKSLELGVVGAILAMILAQLAAMLYCLAVLWKKEHARPTSLPTGAFTDVISYGARYYIASLSVSVNSHLPVLLLASMAKPIDLGWFIAATALTNRISLLPTSINQALQPRLNGSDEQRHEMVAKAVRLLFLVVALCLALIVLASPYFVPVLFSPAFLPIVPLIAILSLGILLRSACRPMMAYFISVNRPGVGSWCTLAQFACVLIAVPWGYQHSGIEGAAWGIVVSQLVDVIALNVSYCIIGSRSISEIWRPHRDDLQLIQSSATAVVKKLRPPPS